MVMTTTLRKPWLGTNAAYDKHYLLFTAICHRFQTVWCVKNQYIIRKKLKFYTYPKRVPAKSDGIYRILHSNIFKIWQ